MGRALGRAEPETYDAFISYSRTDVSFARALETVLEHYRPPRELDLPDRTLKVFRDEGDLTGTEYFRAIEGKLAASSSCILLCSPRSATSRFVNDEVQRFIDLKGAEHVIPVLIEGLPNNEAEGDRAALAAFPPALVAAMEMPLATDYREADTTPRRLAKPPFENQWFTLLANIFGISRERLEQRDRIRQARRRRIWTTGASVIIAALISLSTIALIERSHALTSLAEAESRQLADKALNAPLDDPVYALVYALEGADRAETFEAATALRRTFHDHWVHAILRHEAPVLTARFRPGTPSPGETLTLTEAGEVVWWDNDSGAVLRELSGDTHDAVDARFDPTGRLAVVTHRSGQLTIWRLRDGSARTIDAHPEGIGHVAIAPDGTRMATTGPNGKARLWALPDADLLAEETIRPEPCVARRRLGGLSFSPDGSQLAVGVCDGRTELRDGSTLALGQVIRGGRAAGQVTGLTFASTGDRLAITRVGAVQFWDVTTSAPTLIDEWWPELLVDRVVFFDRDRRALALGVGSVAEWQGADTLLAPLQLEGLQTLHDATVSSNGRWLLTGGADRRGTIWHIPSGAPVALLSGHDREVRDVDLSEDVGWALTASQDSTVRVWRIDPGSHTSFSRVGMNDEFRYSADGRYILHWQTTGSVGGRVTVWDRVTDSITLTVDSTLLGVELGPGPLAVALDILHGSLSIWNAATGEFLTRIPGGVGHAFSPDGSVVARWGYADPLTVWDISSHRADTARGLEERVEYVAFSPSGSRLAAGAEDGTIYILQRDSLDNPPRPLRGHRGPLHYAAFLGDSLLMSASADSTARIWHLESDSVSQVLAGHKGDVLAVAVRSDGQQAVTGSTDWTARVWDLRNGAEITVLRGHTDPVDWVQYDPAQRRVLTRSDQDSTARLWDPMTGRQLALITDQDHHGVDWVWFEGDSLMTGSNRGNVRAHPISFEALVFRGQRHLPVNLTPERRAQLLGCLTPELASQLGYRWCDRWFARSMR